MADKRSIPPTAAATPAARTRNCPAVADLIGYALGQLAGEDRRRIEAHLHDGDCKECRGWIEKAVRFRAEPGPNGTGKCATLGPLLALAPCPPAGDQTPVPRSARWQRTAFRDLEQRLRMLDEG